MGSCPCPRCLTPKRLFDLMGLFKDIQGRVTNLRTYCLDGVARARGFIYGLGHTVDGSKVRATLGEGSWVPTIVSAFGIKIKCLLLYLILGQNAFAERLGPLGFDTFSMLVVDFMHECELGTWKALFTHLIRLLYALPGGDRLVATLDYRFVTRRFPCVFETDGIKCRFRQVPSYGNGVIHKFANNTSEMKRLAARDFEDILQVCHLYSVITNVVDFYLSALCWSLKGYSQRTTTRLYNHCCTCVYPMACPCQTKDPFGNNLVHFG
jgi:hypothetical protein